MLRSLTSSLLYGRVLMAPEGAAGGSPSSDVGHASDSGGSPSPSSSPSPSPEGGKGSSGGQAPGGTEKSGADSDSAAAGSDPWGGFSNDDLGVEEVIVDAPAGEKKPVEVKGQEGKPDPKKVEGQKPGEQEPGKDALKPEGEKEEPPKPQGPQETSTPLSPAEPGRIAQGMREHYDDVVKHLAQTKFKLSDADVEALQDDAVAHTPVLLARAFVESHIATMQFIQQSFPAMLQNHLKVLDKQKGNADKFYDQWKEQGIDRVKHGELVDRLAKTYRQMNPKAPFDQMVKELGAIVVATAGITPPKPTSKGNGGKQQPFKPALSGPASSPSGEKTSWLDGMDAATDEE